MADVKIVRKCPRTMTRHFIEILLFEPALHPLWFNDDSFWEIMASKTVTIL